MLDHARNAQLIGRQVEFGFLWRSFEASAAGGTRVVLIAGEPGIGKTRLLAAFAQRATEHGATILRGGASQFEGMPPYLPFLKAFGQHIRATPVAQLRAQVGRLAAILATILPELPSRLNQTPENVTFPPEQARLRLFEAAGEFLAAIASDSPVALLLDDVQWADPASLDLLHAIARYQPDARLVIVGAYRSGEIEQNPALTRLVTELNRLRRLDVVQLGALARDETRDLARDLLGAPLDEAAGARLSEQSEGNPFFAEELLRHWRETGLLTLDASHEPACYRLAQPVAVTVPPGIVATVHERIARLAPESAESLRTAAIIGRTFDIPTLAATIGAEPEAVEETLRPAVQADLIRTGDPGRYRFSHDKIRECLYDELTSTRRQRLHGYIGRALEARAEPPDARLLSDLAYHFVRSGDRDRGFTYALRAAEQSSRSFAFAEAVAHFTTALELSDVAGSGRATLLMRLGEAADLAGDEQHAGVAFSAAHEAYLLAGEPDAAARALHRLGRARIRQEEIGEARAAFEAALALLAEQPGRLLVELLVDLGTLLAVSQHELDAGIAHAQRALDLARQLDDGRLLAVAQRALGNLLVRGNDLSAGVPLLERALRQAEAINDLVEAAECCGCLAPAYFWQGRLNASREIARRRLTFAQRSHDRYQLRHVYTWLAVIDAMQGKFNEADRLLNQAQALVEQLASPEPLAYVTFCRAALRFMVGDLAAAGSLSRTATEAFRAIGPSALVWYLGFHGLILATAGKIADARSSLDELDALLTLIPAGTTHRAESLACMLQTALLLDDDRAARYAWELQPFAGQFHDFLIDRLLGQFELRQGLLAEAKTHLERAELLARRESLNWELTRTREAQAMLALATPEPARPLPAGLSRREAEVLRHVASGLSNREIAEALFLSEKTVINHLTSIFNKTGLDNRTAAAAFAIRNGLAD
jgi:predicted ATPase/DNA-binding CsgD family transcriptional regulator